MYGSGIHYDIEASHHMTLEGRVEISIQLLVRIGEHGSRQEVSRTSLILDMPDIIKTVMVHRIKGDAP